MFLAICNYMFFLTLIFSLSNLLKLICNFKANQKLSFGPHSLMTFNNYIGHIIVYIKTCNNIVWYELIVFVFIFIIK